MRDGKWGYRGLDTSQVPKRARVKQIEAQRQILAAVNYHRAGRGQEAIPDRQLTRAVSIARRWGLVGEDVMVKAGFGGVSVRVDGADGETVTPTRRMKRDLVRRMRGRGKRR